VYAVELLPSAAKALGKLERRDQVRIGRRIDRLAHEPRRDAVKLIGANDIWRVRIGDYRVLFRIEDDRIVVLVIRIAHRREVYR
jgi:mRNA interferase RelE/StbE